MGRDTRAPLHDHRVFDFLDSHDSIGVKGACGVLSENGIAASVGKAVEHGGLASKKSLLTAL